MQFNNLVATSKMSSGQNRINEFNFTVQYQNNVVIPKAVSLAKCSIPNTALSFRSNELTLNISYLGAIYPVVFQNGYYDNMTEFIPMLNSAIQASVAQNFVFSYNVAYEALQLTNTDNHPFMVMYASSGSIGPRLGFNQPYNYQSFSENGDQVVRGTGMCRLARTSGFFLVSNLVQFNSNTAGPNGNYNIVEFIPIEVNNLSYGDSIVLVNSNLSQNRVELSRNDMFNCSTTFTFQLLDDEMVPILDADKGQNTILMFNLDYD
jgi:hypothetical protein